MADTAESLRRKIDSAGELRSAVRTMKALAASNVGQYERSLLSLADYDRTVELGLGACLRAGGASTASVTFHPPATGGVTSAIVFGSDQGLVGQFNDVVANQAIKALAALPAKSQVWAVGERVRERLADAGLDFLGLFVVPGSIEAISALVGRIQIESEAHRAATGSDTLWVFHNRPLPGALYEPVSQRLLPLDRLWSQRLASAPWPSNTLAEVVGDRDATLHALVREYLFISLFRACAESLASENASRLAAMQRADKNIQDLLEQLRATSNRIRQSGIDEELFDVIAGFEALGGSRRPTEKRP